MQKLKIFSIGECFKFRGCCYIILDDLDITFLCQKSTGQVTTIFKSRAVRWITIVSFLADEKKHVINIEKYLGG